MPRTDAEASLTAFCAASSQLLGDSVRTSITLIRAMMVPPESAWAACPMSSTVHEEDRCAMIGYRRVICPDDRRTAQLSRTSTRLALQLQLPFQVGLVGFGLVAAAPDGPCDDESGLDPALG